jgi:hypothetical protein
VSENGSAAPPSPGRPKHASTGLYVRSTNGLRLRDRKVQRLVRAMRVAMPWLQESDIPACRSWAQLEILSDQAFIILRTIGITTHGGEPRRLLTDFRQLRLAQLAYERELAMTPASRQALRASGTNAAIDIAKSCAELGFEGARAAAADTDEEKP